MDDAHRISPSTSSPPPPPPPPRANTLPPILTAPPYQYHDSISSTADYKTSSADMDQLPRQPPPFYDNSPTTPKGDSTSRNNNSSFRGPGGSPILERNSPILQHRTYQSSTSSISDRRESSTSLSPTLTRQDRMLPPPSPPAQRHNQGYSMELPPLSSVTTGLPARPPSSGSMSISSMLGGSGPPGDMGGYSSHHHHPPPPPPQHHHHRQSRPYTPEYGNPLGGPPPSGPPNPLAPRSQSTPTTPALGYPDVTDSGHGRSNSYGQRLPSNAGPLPTPFRDPYPRYMREPMPLQREDYPPPRRDIMNMEPSSPSQHIPDLQKPIPNPYPPQQAKHVGPMEPSLPPQQPHHHQPLQQQPPQPQPPPPQPPPPQPQALPQQQAPQPPQPPQLPPQQGPSQPTSQSQPPPPSQSRTTAPTNGSASTTRSHHHHHHRPTSTQPSSRSQATAVAPAPPPKIHVNNAPALQAIADITNPPFLGRFIYEPGWIIPSQLTEDALGGKYEVRIAYRFLGRDNLGVQKRKVWGTEIYTDDSDAVAILYHLQKLPPPQWSKPQDLVATFVLLPRLKHYTSTTQNEVRSRGWTVHDGLSIMLESTEWIPLGQAEGVRRGRKRRLDEEFRMGIEMEDVGVSEGVLRKEQEDGGVELGFREVRWVSEKVLGKEVGKMGGVEVAG